MESGKWKVKNQAKPRAGDNVAHGMEDEVSEESCAQLSVRLHIPGAITRQLSELSRSLKCFAIDSVKIR